MSRVSKEKIDIQKLTKYSIHNNQVTLEGAFGTNTIPFPDFLSIAVEEQTKSMAVNFITMPGEVKTKNQAAMHGTVVRLIKNGVTGVTLGFKKTFLFKGLGFKYTLTNPHMLTMQLGYSHPVIFHIPKNIKAVSIKQDKLEVHCNNKEELGMFGAKLIKLRKWNPYSSKGIMEENTVPYTKAVVKAKK